MASEEFEVTTPGKHRVTVRMDEIAEDTWKTDIVYAGQVRFVGRFKGKAFAIDAATKKAAEVADAPPTGGVICAEDDPNCEHKKSSSRPKKKPIHNPKTE
jgi:hypothetical protein